ncbi:MAG: hypothetical protein JWQ11_2743 [Rhizobacter sp.]|nr:hypothetical protein [Rhizobacter sp.]
MSNSLITACCLGLLLPLLGPGSAQAQGFTPIAASAQCEAKGDAPTKAASLFGARRAVSMATLSAQRGGTEVTEVPTLSGSVSGNQASNTVSGSNSITNGAFSNSSGLPVIVQNSGNNVLIQTSTVVNVTIK